MAVQPSPASAAPETGTKLACLNEAFVAPGVYEVELGTPIRQSSTIWAGV